MSNNEEYLNVGDSIEKGYCPKCGDVAVKITNVGYDAGLLMWLFHIFLCIITAGGWLPVWGFLIIFKMIFNKGKKTCMKCDKILKKN